MLNLAADMSNEPYQTRTTCAPPPAGRAQRARRLSALPRHLALVYGALIVYASLHPFAGWRDPGLSVLTFFDAPWPRYWTFFDLLVNIVAYVPLGFLLTLALRRWRWARAGAAMLLAAALSFCLECLQVWLPSRVASNLDLASNALGGGLGALIASCCGERFFIRVTRWQRRLLAPQQSSEGDFGLLLIGLWLLTQLSPETLLFGAGDLRHLLDIPPAVPYEAPSFFAIETGIIAVNCVAVGLIARTLLARTRPPYLELALLLAGALCIRALAAAVLIAPQQAFSWLTPGAGLGLMIGYGTLSVLLLLPAWLRTAAAAVALMGATVLVNVTPPNPYSMVALSVWQHGHFLNFNGLTRLTASLWPFLALAYLTTIVRRT